MNKFYLKEFQDFDGEDDVIFNIVELNADSNKITVAVTKCGKITITDYDLFTDENGLYFEYGVAGREHIHIDDFEEKVVFKNCSESDILKRQNYMS